MSQLNIASELCGPLENDKRGERNFLSPEVYKSMRSWFDDSPSDRRRGSRRAQCRIRRRSRCADIRPL